MILSSVSCSIVKQEEIISDNSENIYNSSAEKTEDIVLTYAYYGEMDSLLQSLIDKFNAEGNGYQLVIKDYSDILQYGSPETRSATEESRTALKIQLYQDIINGEVSIIDSSVLGTPSTFEILKNQGAFVDLYKFMENDPDINRSTLNETVLTLNEIDGKLYNLPTFFGIETMFGEAKYVGIKENWTFDEFVYHWEQMPEGATIAGHKEKEYVFLNFLCNMLYEFVDYKNGTASFNSPKFRSILEFCNDNFVTISDVWINGSIDYESPSFVNSLFITGLLPFYENVKDEHTLVGYPSSNGKGACIDTSIGRNFAINNVLSEKEQQGAWQFIRKFADIEYQLNQYNPTFDDGNGGFFYQEETGIPINNKAFEEGASQIINGEIYSPIITAGGEEIERGLPTQEEYQSLVEYIDTINMLKTHIDDDLKTIITDEIYAYFNGEKTIDETIEIIQNRASIMVSEKS